MQAAEEAGNRGPLAWRFWSQLRLVCTHRLGGPRQPGVSGFPAQGPPQGWHCPQGWDVLRDLGSPFGAGQHGSLGPPGGCSLRHLVHRAGPQGVDVVQAQESAGTEQESVGSCPICPIAASCLCGLGFGLCVCRTSAHAALLPCAGCKGSPDGSQLHRIQVTAPGKHICPLLQPPSALLVTSQPVKYLLPHRQKNGLRQSIKL